MAETQVLDAPKGASFEVTRDAGVGFFYAVPCLAVDNCDAVPNSSTSPHLNAKLANGKPLPAWLKFDASTATFYGQAPAQTTTVVAQVLRVGSGAQAGANATTLVTLKFLGGSTLATR
jgi:hypothetical protein